MVLRSAAAMASGLLLCLPASAAALISDVQQIDGPSADIVELGGTAMSEDGTGGLVYLKREAGRNHVFAAQYVGGAWRAPQRVDVGQGFDSSWARIGAGDGGRLVVTWVQEFGVNSDRMFSAALDPGARRFQAPVPVDFNVGEATATFPSLAMSRTGQAYLTYRVITDTSSANPPGYVGADVRLARYGGSLWSSVGLVDRNSAIPVRSPTAANSPKVAIDVQNQGIVAFQEPDDEFVDRVYARRIFGTTTSIPLLVSPQDFEGAPLRGPADGFSLDVAGFGQGAVAFRQQPGEGSRLPGTRIFVNEISDVFTDTSGAFGGARLIDESPRENVGLPSVAVTPGTDFVAGFASGDASLLGSGTEADVGAVQRLDDAGSSGAGDPVVDLGETGAAVAAWKDLRGGRGAVNILERRADGVPESVRVSAARGGSVSSLMLGGSGRGDGIVAFQQGGLEFGQIAAAVVDAPPSDFFILLPDGWQRRREVPISWDPSFNSVSAVRYSVSVDDEPVLEDLRARRATLGAGALENGRHQVQIFAVDGAGQETGSQTAELLVDRRRPTVRVRVRGRTVRVTLSDGRRRQVSGLRRAATRVRFSRGGKAKRVRGLRVAKRYPRAGRFLVTVRARDRAGNRVTVKRRVRVR